MRGWLVTALLPPPWRAPPGARGAAPRSCGVRGHLTEEGGGGLLMACSVYAAFGGCCSARTSWFACVLLCPVGARLTAVCGAALCPVALLLAFLPILGSFFFHWHAHRCWCAAPGGAACRSLPPIPPRDLLERGGGGGGGGSGGRPPSGTYPIHKEQKNYWRMNNSAYGNVMLSAVNKGNSSLNVNSRFPHLTNTQQLQQSGTFTISCQMIVIFLVSQN